MKEISVLLADKMTQHLSVLFHLDSSVSQDKRGMLRKTLAVRVRHSSNNKEA